MLSLPATIAAQLSRRDGAAPVWLLRFTAGGVAYTLCQDAINIPPWGLTALPWIASWGQLTQGVTGTLADFVCDNLTVNLINDPNASPNLYAMARVRQLHAAQFSVYLWADGAADPPFEMFRLYVSDLDMPDEVQVNLTLRDITTRYQKYYPGTLLDQAAYPHADPDDIGKMIPMVFGSVQKLLTLAADAGVMTSLPNAIGATDTAIVVSDANLTAGMTIQVDDEQMTVTAASGASLTVTRGVNATVAATHAPGAVVWEVKSEFIYIACDYPITSMPKAYGRVGQAIMDISAICTVWPDGSHPNYPGKAVLSVPGYITVAQAVDLLVSDGIGVSDLLTILDGTGILDGITVGDNIGIDNLLAILDGIGVSDTIAVSDTIGVAGGNLSDSGHTHTIGATSTQTATNCPVAAVFDGNSNAVATVNFPSPTGTLTGVSYTVTVQKTFSSGSNIHFSLQIYVNGTLYVNDASIFQSLAIGQSQPYTFSVNSGDLNVNSILVLCTWWQSGGTFTVTAASRNISYSGSVTPGVANVSVSAVSKTGNASKTGLASKTGTTTLGGSIGKTGSASRAGSVNLSGNVTRSGGVFKTGTVTVTGNSTANTLIGDAILVDCVSPYTAPGDVLGQVFVTPCQVVGAFPAGYAFNGVIRERQDAVTIAHTLARQCRSYFRFRLDVPTLIVRPAALVPVHTISEVRLNSGAKVHGQKLTDIGDVINTINAQYDRDWSQDGTSASAYRQVEKQTDATVNADGKTSVQVYGVCERPDLFKFDFVTDPAMAADVVAFWLRWQAWQRWCHTMEAYLAEAALEYADPVALGFSSGEVGEVMQTGFSPGNGAQMDKLQLTVFE